MRLCESHPCRDRSRGGREQGPQVQPSTPSQETQPAVTEKGFLLVQGPEPVLWQVTAGTAKSHQAGPAEELSQLLDITGLQFPSV